MGRGLPLRRAWTGAGSILDLWLPRIVPGSALYLPPAPPPGPQVLAETLSSCHGPSPTPGSSEHLHLPFEAPSLRKLSPAPGGHRSILWCKEHLRSGSCFSRPRGCLAFPCVSAHLPSDTLGGPLCFLMCVKGAIQLPSPLRKDLILQFPG